LSELAPQWVDKRESGLEVRRKGKRLRGAGAGRNFDLVFTDRVIVTLVYLRTGLSQEALADMYGCSPSSISRAISEVRPLLAKRGFATKNNGPKLHTMADAFAYARATSTKLRIDGTEVPVRRPRANKKGRRRFVSGKKRQNTIKFTVISDEDGNVLWAGGVVPGRMHDQTAAGHAGINDLLEQFPSVVVSGGNAYRGLFHDHPGQVVVPPLKPDKEATEEAKEEYEKVRHAQSSERIPVEHSIGKVKWWKPLQRWTGVRENLQDTFLAAASLASEGAAA